jgi:hypothetical protein
VFLKKYLTKFEQAEAAAAAAPPAEASAPTA